MPICQYANMPCRACCIALGCRLIRSYDLLDDSALHINCESRRTCMFPDLVLADDRNDGLTAVQLHQSTGCVAAYML